MPRCHMRLQPLLHTVSACDLRLQTVWHARSQVPPVLRGLPSLYMLSFKSNKLARIAEVATPRLAAPCPATP